MSKLDEAKEDKKKQKSKAKEKIKVLKSLLEAKSNSADPV